jgi:hypothetical protein
MTELKTNNVGAIRFNDSVIPEHLIGQIVHWSQWINRKEKRLFLIVDSIQFEHTSAARDELWILEQGVRKPDGSRKFFKVGLEQWIELITSGSLEYFDPAMFLKTQIDNL